jgi:cytochrome oxidase Cu insertion factor (SCO1/SenC/PrrC family)
MKMWDSVLAIGICSAVLAAQAPPKAANTTAQTNAKVGQMAPDFTLHSTTGKDITLSEYRGKKNVVLAFIVKAFTGG